MRKTIEEILCVSQWLSGDDTGLSSKSLSREFLGLPHDNGISHPHDPADIGRCFRLIEKCPSVRNAVNTLGGKCRIWRNLAERWDEIYRSMGNEVGIHWEKASSAPKTYELMCDIIKGNTPTTTNSEDNNELIS
jgi:hypothetical protein